MKSLLGNTSGRAFDDKKGGGHPCIYCGKKRATVPYEGSGKVKGLFVHEKCIPREVPLPPHLAKLVQEKKP